MNIHKNAGLTARGRERIAPHVESGEVAAAVAEAAGVCLADESMPLLNGSIGN